MLDYTTEAKLIDDIKAVPGGTVAVWQNGNTRRAYLTFRDDTAAAVYIDLDALEFCVGISPESVTSLNRFDTIAFILADYVDAR
jgi:hypothetical protein